MTELAYPTLFSPVRIGQVQVPNRIAMAPHSTHYADRVESERLSRYYAERARGGVGLIIHEPVIVHPSSLSRAGKVWGYDEANVSAYRRTTDAVHEHGTRIFCQLIHNGRQVDGFASGMPAWYPSEVSRPGTSESTHAMTRAEIAEVVLGFADAARICAAGGFDGVEVHAAHGYLLQAFLSPATNQRDDEYGGSLDNRVRIVTEVVRAVRAAVGVGLAVGVRLSADEVQPGGLDADGCRQVALALAAEPIDYLSVVSGSLGSYDQIVPDMSFERGLNVELAAGLREAVSPLPILVTGRIPDAETAEAVLSSGKADVIGLARALIADPLWAEKSRSGHVASVRPCVYANDCRDSIGGRRSLECMVNPGTGHEGVEPPGSGPSGSRRVVVVGAGPAGVEAAVAAAQLGDEVVLLESTDRIGGQLALAATPASRAELGRLLRHYESLVAGLPIDLRLDTPATGELLTALDPELLVLASGAHEARSRLGDDVVSSWEVLRGAALATEDVVVFDEGLGNGWPLFSAAEVLADRGHRVRVVLPGNAPGTSVEAASLPPLLRRLHAAGARIDTMSSVVTVGAGTTVVRHAPTGLEERLDGAACVTVTHRRAAPDPTSGWTPSHPLDVRTVGDAWAPRRLATAIRDGRAAVAPAPAPVGAPT